MSRDSSKAELTFDDRDKQASALTDKQVAEQLNLERNKLFKRIQGKQSA